MPDISTSGRSLGWAVIGASTIAREFMVDAIRAAGGEPLWVVSGSAELAARFARDCAIPRHTTELAEALADGAVAAVYVGSANSKHCAQVLAAAKAGKHVLCDKPLASRRSDAVEMVRACEKAGVVLAVNHHLRASPVHKEMRKRIAAGEIGDARSLLILHAGWLRPELQTWRLSDPAEGAIYLDLSVHDIDLARFLLNQEPLTAIGLGGTLSLGANGVHDHAMYALVMNGGTFVQVHESFVTPGAESQVLVLGSEGTMTAVNSLRQTPGGSLTVKRDGAAELVEVGPENPYLDTLRQFLAAVATGQRPLASGYDGLIALQAAEAVAAAAAKGRSVNVQSRIRV